MKTIFVMMDSLNRHYLNAYEPSWIKTPNIDRLAARGVRFDNHYSGSLPCMPARREMMTGRMNFLEAPWGPIEPWDDCLPTLLRNSRGTYTHLITDHYHYFHSGGEAYHTLFDSWELERGQEGDRWHPAINPLDQPERPKEKQNQLSFYMANRKAMDPEQDESYSTPRCFQRAIEFLEQNGKADNWHLHLEVFDPHEPFDCPTKYRELYDDVWDKPYFSWPDYLPVDPATDDESTIKHIRKCYAGSLTMADTWLGKFLDTMDRMELWKEVVLVFGTDHGHLLGEHGYWAKNYMFDYEELVHIPLIVCSPEVKGGGGRIASLTATIDLAPTILDLHSAEIPQSVQGKSLLPLIRSHAAATSESRDIHALHDAVLFGYFGKDLNLFDGRHSYCRQPIPGSVTHHHTAMPRLIWDFVDRQSLAKAEMGVYLQDCHGIPHYRIAVESHRHANAPDFNPIYDIAADPGQTKPIHDDALEKELADKLRKLLVQYHAPDCQLRRTGLA